MRRLLLIPLALLGLATASALASVNRASTSTAAVRQANSIFTGTISSLAPTGITVGARKHHRLSCTLTTVSPATTEFAAGDRVKIACVHHVLVAIADAPFHHSPGANASNADATTTGISGAIVTLDQGSIVVHDGDRTVTCTLGAGSPSTAGYSVGQHARIGCENGALVSIGPPGSGLVTDANGPITALGGTSISVQTMTCTIGAGSPSTDGFHLGDSVRMYCVNGALYVLKHNDTPPTTTTTTTTQAPTGAVTGITGAIGALGTASITVTGGDGGTASLTCTIGPSSPSTAGFALGSLVRMYCLNGVLYQLRHNDTTTTTTTTTTATTTTTSAPTGTVTGINGTITALGATSITVTGGDSGTATLTCPIGPSSPSTAGFAVGSPVRMYCLNGVLYQLKHNDTTTTTPTTTTTTTTGTTTTAGTYTAITGPIGALSASSITVASSGGDGPSSLTCTLGTGTPSTSGFAVGNTVRMYCLNGALFSLAHN